MDELAGSSHSSSFDSSTKPSKASSGVTPTAAAPQRSRLGCLTCRRRKVKCDEARPKCARCCIKSRQCIWTGDVGDEHLIKRRVKRPAHDTDFHLLLPPITTPSPFTSFLNEQQHQQHQQQQTLSLSLGSTSSQYSFDPALFLDLVPILPPPTSSRFYVPPDFLPKTTSLEIPSQYGPDNLIAMDQKAKMMADPAFLQPYFPNIEERLIMRHYLLHTVHIIIAFECHRKPWNPWVEIHAPLAFNHLPGTLPASDALRAAIIAVGAVHLRYRHNPQDQIGAWKIVQSAKAKVLSLVRQTIDAQDKTGTPLDKSDIELILAALLSCTIASSLAADDSWQELLTSVLALVERLGGAQVLLKEGSHNQLSSFRFFLEQLAIRDVFGCMTTELEPSILNTAFSPWFFEAESWSRGDDEWESVERMFGISRGMVDVIARSCTLISQVKGIEGKISEASGSPPIPGSATSFTLRLPAKAVARSNHGDPTQHTVDVTPMHAAKNELLTAEANGLIAELGVWDKSSNFTPFHPRTQYGNHSYRHATRIRLLREVFGVGKEDPRVQTSIAAIIELGVELLATYGRITWLTWPIVIAAFNMLLDDPARKTALGLLGEFGHYASFDNGAACRMLLEFWKDEDEDGTVTPALIAHRLKSRPFLD